MSPSQSADAAPSISPVSHVPYTVRRSDRARYARVVVSAESVELVVPRRMALRHAEPLLEEKRPWIERTLRRMREAQATVPPPLLEDGAAVPYLGRQLALRVRVEPGRRRPHVARRGDTLHVKVARSSADALRSALESWYRRRARIEVAARLDAAVARAGVGYRHLSIRGQRTRWASCSSSGAMSFNWRLLLAPERVLDYVVEHEVAHLSVLDHSPLFWRLLAERSPDYREHERWLKLHGSALRL